MAQSEVVEMFCTQCGKDIPDGSVFCTECGAPMEPVGQPAEAPTGATAPPPQAAVTSPPPGPPAAAAPPGVATGATKPGRKWLLPVVGLVALAVIAAVVLVLVFVVFKGGSGPEDAVKKFLEAVQDNNINTVVSLVDPVPFKLLPGSKEAFRQDVKENAPMGKVEFQGLKLKGDVEGNKAEVKATGGTAKYKDEKGKTVTEGAGKFVGTAYCVKRQGSWYLSEENFADFWAKNALKKADEEIADLEAKMASGMIEIQTVLSTFGTGVTTPQQMDDQFKVKKAQTMGTLDGLIKQGALAKARYTRVSGLEGAEDYKRYADLRLEQIQGATELIKLLKEFLNDLGSYISNLAVNPPSTAEAMTQGFNDIENKFTSDLGALQAQYGETDAAVEELKQSLGL